MRDLTDPAQGAHAVQVLLDSVVTALQIEWGSTARYVRSTPIVPVRENYDRLGYDPGDVTRARRYTHYISKTVMLRSHTSAELPTALEDYSGKSHVDDLLVHQSRHDPQRPAHRHRGRFEQDRADHLGQGRRAR